MNQLALSVIIPFYNESSTLPLILKKVLAQNQVNEIILVDDGSTDKTLKVLSKLKIKNFKFKIIRHQKNKGKGAAIRTGIKLAKKNNLVLIQDADLEYDPKDYNKLLKPLLGKEAEFVIGNRWNNQRGYKLAQLGNWFLNRLINILFQAKYHDPYSGYKLGSKKLWQKLNLTSAGFEIEAEIACKLALMKVPVKEVKISYQPRKYSEGKKIGILDVFKGSSTIFQTKAGSLS